MTKDELDKDNNNGQETYRSDKKSQWRLNNTQRAMNNEYSGD